MLDNDFSFLKLTVPCALEKKVYSVFGWNVVKISMGSISSNILLNTCVFLTRNTYCFNKNKTENQYFKWSKDMNRHFSEE